MSVNDNIGLSALAEARLLHTSAAGFFSVARATAPDRRRGGWKESYYPNSALEEATHAARNQPDTYISQASFLTRRRAVANTKMLRCAWVDLDCYKLGLLPDEATIAAVLRTASESGLPAPTYITSSGRGLYAKWVFRDPISSDLLPQWQTLQDLLVALYRQLGSDAGVKDAARVLRLAQTINSKSQSLVQVVASPGTLYSFGELCAAAAKVDVPLAVGSSTQQARAIHRIRSGLQGDTPTDFGALSTYALSREPILMRRGSIQTLNWNRFLDLRDLSMARGGIHKGARDLTLFWMTSFLALAQVITPANLWNEVHNLLLAFPVGPDFDPMREQSLSTLVRRIHAHDGGKRIQYRGREYSPIYTPTNDTLLNMLEITPEEERGLRTIISGQEKQRRVDLKCPGRAERRDERHQAQRAAATLQAAGRSVREIAALVGRPLSTVYRWLDASREGQTVVETRGRRTGARPQAIQPAGRAERALSGLKPCELERRTKLHRKPHLQPAGRMRAEELAAWLAKRKEHQARNQQLAEQARAQEKDVRVAKEAQAALVTQILLTSLREKAQVRARHPSISLSKGGSLSSTKTGPPGQT